MMYDRFVTAPPGLDSLDEMTPAKVELSSSFAPCYLTQTQSPALDAGYMSSQTPAYLKDHMMDSSYYAAHFSSGEWAAKVNSVAPYLNTQGIHRALAILDQATRNVQQAKALDEAMASQPCQAGQGITPYFQCATTCSMLLVQLHEQQQRLLGDLQRLPLDPASVRDHSSPDPAVAGAQLWGNPALSLPERIGIPMSPSMSPAIEPSPKAPGSPNAKGSQLSLSASAARKVQTLSTSLQLLSAEDPDCLFIVRRINKLGFKAVRTLKRHFSMQGPVLKVLLAHSTVRQHGDPACHARRRPSSLGFVQMGDAEGTAKVLALGTDQEVDGVVIRVQRFERQRLTEALEDEGEPEDANGFSTPKWKDGSRGSISFSEDSTSTRASPLASPSLTHQGSHLVDDIMDASPYRVDDVYFNHALVS